MVNNYPLVNGTIYTAEMANKAVRSFVRFGCSVCQARTTATMTLTLAAGEVVCDGEVVSFSATTQAITAADGSNPRWDLIGIKIDTSLNTATKVYYTGTAAASPSKPTITVTDEPVVPLAFIYVPASDTTISDNQIYDARPIIGNKHNITFFIHGANIAIGASALNFPSLESSAGGVECYLPDVIGVIDGAIWLAQQTSGSDAVTITYTSTIDGSDSQATAIAMTLTTTPTKVDLTTHLQKHAWSSVQGKRFRLTAVVTTGSATNSWGGLVGGMNVVLGGNQA